MERVLNGDFRLVTQGLKRLEREMNDNWDKLLQLSTPTGRHRDSFTGFLEGTDADTSVLDLGSKSPPPKPSLDRITAADTARTAPYTAVNLDLSWDYPKDKSSNESGDSTDGSSKKVLIYHD